MTTRSQAAMLALEVGLMAYGAIVIWNSMEQLSDVPSEGRDQTPPWLRWVSFSLGLAAIATGAVMGVFVGGRFGVVVVLLMSVAVAAWIMDRYREARRFRIRVPESVGEFRIRPSQPLARWKPWGPGGRVWVPPSHEVTLRVTDPSWDVSDLASLRPDGIQGLDVSGMPIDDVDVEAIVQLSGLRFLDLSDTKVTNLGIELLTGLPNLEYLNLRGIAVTREGFASLANLHCLWQVDVDPRDFDATEPLREKYVAVSVSTADRPSLSPRPDTAFPDGPLWFTRRLVPFIRGDSPVSDDLLTRAGDAIGYSEWVLREFPKDLEAWHSKAVALALLNRTDAALAAAREAARADPTEAATLQLLVYLHLAQGNAAQARQVADLATRRDPANPDILLTTVDAHRNRVFSTMTRRGYRTLASIIRLGSTDHTVVEALAEMMLDISLRPLPDVGSAAGLADVIPLAPDELQPLLRDRIRILSRRNWVLPAVTLLGLTSLFIFLRSTSIVATMEPWWWLIGVVPALVCLLLFFVQWVRLTPSERRALASSTPTVGVRPWSTALAFTAPFLIVNSVNLGRSETNFTPQGLEWLSLAFQVVVVLGTTLALARLAVIRSSRKGSDVGQR